MKNIFQGNDFGPLVFGREILKSNQKAELEFKVQRIKISSSKEEGLWESDFWEPALKEILQIHTRFGRIGIFYDRKNEKAQKFFSNWREQLRNLNYVPKDKKRAEKTPRFLFFKTQILYHMANEGWSDTVEFRRIVRKFLRQAKHSHCDSLFFCEAIFGEEKTKKILQHIAGTQMKIFVPSDFLDTTFFSIKGKKTEQRLIKIFTQDNFDFTHQRAEKILQTKLKQSDIHKQNT